ncbi:MAG: peptidase T [Acholeplasmataceae bacterium]|nr:peptidase T [Acholeplasmataceae bacterium]
MKSFARFLNYVKINTMSDPNSTSHPSTKCQFNLGKVLVDELLDLGVTNAYMDKYGYVYGYIPSNSKKDIKTIGFISHMDTSPDLTGENVNPRMIFNYNGEDVVLNEEKNIVMSVKEFPFLKNRVGETLIVTDGTTLLGADDKAGIAEIMTLVEYIHDHKEFEHGMIRICFTPDEEIGEGTSKFNYEEFKVDFAYTVDGGAEGSIDYENFNAASADVEINGINIHPGSAKGHMINSILIAMEFNNLLPSFNKPENTTMYEGFNHLNDIEGTVENTKMHYIIRNHDKELFNKQKQNFLDIQEFLNKKYETNPVKVTIKDTYYNMYEYLKDHMEIVDIAKEATIMEGITPIISPIRGGTDGATLTYNNILCPNLGTGGYNCHGRYECITTEAMDRCVNILINIVKIISR